MCERNSHMAPWECPCSTCCGTCGPRAVSLLTRKINRRLISVTILSYFLNLGHFFMIKIKRKPHAEGVRKEKRENRVQGEQRGSQEI